MDEDIISDEEWELADKLRHCCTPMGDEKETSLKQSSVALFDMGKLYLNKAFNTKGMLQKLNFIKCATLLHGARIRFEKLLNDNEMGSEVRKVLNIMGDSLIHACGGQDYDIGFLEASWKLEFFLNELRETEKENLEKLEIITNDVSESELWEKRARRIKVIRKTLERNTSHYKAIMCGITIECYMILGKPPCKYAIVGLGSLAREEVTLYSDFEHVIIIDDAVKELTVGQQEEIQEYFRWFTVIFQILIIGIGETFIRSVGVKSLNDLYSGDASKNWYYDMFTPSGISFDGRVPHSCNIPLGRQETTKTRNSKVELIQPASKMAKFLTSNEHLKNGYYLSDLLSRTCFVIGDTELYEYFRTKTFETLGTEDSTKSVEEWEEMLVPKSGTILNNSMSGAIKTFCDIKTMFYRPVTAILAYWARKWRFTSGSTFDCVLHIKNHPRAEGLPLKWCDRLEYTVAAVCEMRLKAYATGKNQRLKVLQQDVDKFVGNSTILFCCDVIRELYATVESSELKNTSPSDNGCLQDLPPTLIKEINDCRAQAQHLNIMGHHNGARILLESLAERRDLGHLAFDIRLSLALTYVFLGDELAEMNENRMELFTKAENIMSDLMCWKEFCGNAYGRATICAKLASIYFNQNSIPKMASVLRRWFSAFSNDDISLINKQLLLMRALDAINEFEPWEIREYFVKVLTEDEDLLSKLILQLALACADLSDGSAEVARRNILEIFEKCEENIGTFDQDLLDRFLGRVIEIQGKQMWLVDSFLTMELVSGMRTSQRSAVDNTDTFKLFTNPVQRLILFLFASETEKKQKRKIRYVFKAIAICQELERTEHKTENLIEQGKKQYPRAISQLFACCDFEHITRLCSCYLEVPHYVRGNSSVKRSTTAFIRNFLHHCTLEVKSGKLPSIYGEFMKVSGTFAHLFSHPACILEINDFLLVLNGSDMMKFFPVWQRWIKPNEGDSRIIRIFNSALHMLSKYDVVNSSKLFWKLLHYTNCDRSLKRKVVILLQFVIQICPNVICMLHLSYRWMLAVAEHKGELRTSKTKLYNEVIGMHDVDKQANFFWRFIVSEDYRSPIYVKSLLFFLCILDKKLSESNWTLYKS